MIRLREAAARKLGIWIMVVDTSKENFASSNSLIREGYTLFEPQEPWGFATGHHWRKKLDTTVQW